MTIQSADQTAQWLRPLAIGVLAMISVTVLYLGQVIFIPLALGIIVSFLLQPLVRLLERVGLPRIPAVIIVVLLVSVILAGFGWGVGRQLGELARDLRTNQTYVNNLESKIVDLQRFVGGGALADLQATLDRVGSKLEGPEGNGKNETAVVVRAEPQSHWATIMAAISPLMEPLGTTALVVMLVIFMLISRVDLRNRLIGLFGLGQLSVTTRALDDAGRRIGRYLMMQLLLNASYGLCLGLVLFMIGVPFALLWGLIAALLRYVPYVGPAMGAVFPIVTSFVAFEGWSQPVMVVSFVLALELFSNMVMEPLLFGQSVGISAVGLVLTAALWTLLWGPIGLVLATPLTVCLVVLGQHVPQFRIFVMLFGDAQVLPPHVRFYQRLLARDRQEAKELTREFLGEESEFHQTCDNVLMPALVRARKDRYREQISAQDEDFVLQATQDILEELAQPSPGANGLSATEAIIEQPAFRILGCAAHHRAEELAVTMLQQALGPAGHCVHLLTTKTLPTEIIDLVRQQHWDALFLAVIPPSGMSQAGYLCRRIRKTFPDLPVIVGYWGNKKRFDEVLVKLRSQGATYVTTSIEQSQKQISDLAALANRELSASLIGSGHATDSDD